MNYFLPKKWLSKVSTSSVTESRNFDDTIKRIAKIIKSMKSIPLNLNNSFINKQGVFLPLFRGWDNCLFDWNPFRNALIQSISMYSKYFRYLGKCHFLAINNVKSIYAPIVLLLFARHPSAIRRLIAAIIINPINCHAMRLLSHIDKKIFKRIKPAFANLDPAPAVMLEKWGFWIKTSLLHPTPNPISRTSRQSGFGICLMKLSRAGRSTLSVNATTRFSSAIHKMIASNCFYFSTIAFANPCCALFRKIPTQYQQSAKPFISNINKGTHKIILKVVNCIDSILKMLVLSTGDFSYAL